VFSCPLIVSLWRAPEPGEAHDRYLCDRYLDMLDEGATAIARAIDLIVRHPGSTVFHCMAGKDRTGLVAAIVHELLGVSAEDIVDDYELSAEAMPALHEMFVATHPEQAAMITSQPSVLAAAPRSALVGALDEVRNDHGSIERYLVTAGLSSSVFAALRALMIED
jgi:protein-tyrosine phosphatase